MVDTSRTVAELLTIFADNASGDISAQDMRDFVVSVPGLMPPGLFTVDTVDNIAEGVNTTIDFDGEAPNRDTLGITWNVGAEGFEVAEDGVYAINAYAVIDGLNWDAEFPTTILSIVHDASEPNVRSRSYGGNVNLHCALTIPLAEGETFRAAVQYITDAVDPTHDVVVLLQVTRLGDIPA